MKRQKVRGKKRSGGVSIDVCDINLFITDSTRLTLFRQSSSPPSSFTLTGDIFSLSLSQRDLISSFSLDAPTCLRYLMDKKKKKLPHRRNLFSISPIIPTDLYKYNSFL